MNLPELAKLRSLHNQNVELLVELRDGTDQDAIERAENAAQASLTAYWTARGYPGAASIGGTVRRATIKRAVDIKVSDTGGNPAPKRRGRPPGSKNRVKNGGPPQVNKDRLVPVRAGTKVAVNGVPSKGRRKADTVDQAPRKRGRPKGSKNKPKG